MLGNSSSQTPPNGGGLHPSFSLNPPSSASRDGLAPPRAGSLQASPRTRPTIHFSTGNGGGSNDIIEDMSLPAAGPSEYPTETTALLESVLGDRRCSQGGRCVHGTFSPRTTSPEPSDGSSDTGVNLLGDGPSAPAPMLDGLVSALTGSQDSRNWRHSLAKKVRSKKMSTTSVLAERHGLTDTGSM